MPRKTIPLITRVTSRVEIRDDRLGCWWFTGAIDASGYGRVGLGGRRDGVGYAHRVTFEFFRGPIPTGHHIDHLCMNRACCNPWHLEAVTQAENNTRAAMHRVGAHVDHPFYIYGVAA